MRRLSAIIVGAVFLVWAFAPPAGATPVAQCAATATGEQCQVGGSPMDCTPGQIGTATRTSLTGAVTLQCGATNVAQDDGDPLTGPQPVRFKVAGPMFCVASGGATGSCTTTSPSGKPAPPVPSATTWGLLGLGAALAAAGSFLARRRSSSTAD